MNLSPNKKYYCILGPARSGTTALHLLLKGHQNICAINDEVKIARVLREGISVFTYGNNSMEENSRSPWMLFKFLSEYNINSESCAFGMKAALSDPREVRHIAKIFAEKLQHIFIIACIRNDLLAQYASLKRAHETGNWHSWVTGSEKAGSYKLFVDPIMYSQYYVDQLRLIEEIRSLSNTNPYLEISYEGDIAKGLGYSQKLFDFLSIPYVYPSWFDSRKISRPVEEYVTNHLQIRELEKELQVSKCPLKEKRTSRLFRSAQTVRRLVDKIDRRFFSSRN
jgi:hypothetical protein